MTRATRFNNYRVAGDTATLELTDRHGNKVGETLIDAADLPMLLEFGHRWSLRREKKRRKSYAKTKSGSLLLHRLLVPDAPQVDHINGNGLDNRRANLRACTNAENQRNRGRSANNKSGYKGVRWHAASRRWRAQIVSDGQQRTLGHFYSPEAAARAYDRAARQLHGEFARLNFPDDQQPTPLLKAVGL